MKYLLSCAWIILLQISLLAQTETGVAGVYSDAFDGRTTASGEKYNKNELTAAHKTLPFNTMVEVTSSTTGKSVTVRINDRGPYEQGRVIDISRKAAQMIGLDKEGKAKVTTKVVNKDAPTVAATAPKPTTTPTATNTPQPTTKPAPQPSTTAATTTTTTPTSTTRSTSTSTPKPDKVDNLTIIEEASVMEPGGLYKTQVLKVEPNGYGVQVAGYSDLQSVMQQIAVLQANWFKGAMVYVDELNGEDYYRVILGPFFSKAEADSYAANLRKKYNMKDAFVIEMSKFNKE